MKRGVDYEVELLSRLLPIVTCDVFLPADILNRLLAEFMSASRPLVAISLTPTIFQVSDDCDESAKMIQFLFYKEN